MLVFFLASHFFQAPPPKLHHREDMDSEHMDDSDDMGKNAAPAPKPTSLQQRMLALSGQNIDDFMKEMEEVHKKRERDRAADLNARLVFDTCSLQLLLGLY